jgi:hypothetical protein
MRYPGDLRAVTLTVQMPTAVETQRTVRRTEVKALHESWSAPTYKYIPNWKYAVFTYAVHLVLLTHSETARAGVWRAVH